MCLCLGYRQPFEPNLGLEIRSCATTVMVIIFDLSRLSPVVEKAANEPIIKIGEENIGKEKCIELNE